MGTARDVIIYLEDIYDSAILIIEYVEGLTEQDFLYDLEKQDAVTRRIQIIGEAAKHISPSYKKKWSDIPWRDIAGMRDILVHEYFGITISMIWKVATEDIPILKEQIEDILDSME